MSCLKEGEVLVPAHDVHGLIPIALEIKKPIDYIGVAWIDNALGHYPQCIQLIFRESDMRQQRSALSAAEVAAERCHFDKVTFIAVEAGVGDFFVEDGERRLVHWSSKPLVGHGRHHGLRTIAVIIRIVSERIVGPHALACTEPDKDVGLSIQDRQLLIMPLFSVVVKTHVKRFPQNGGHLLFGHATLDDILGRCPASKIADEKEQTEECKLNKIPSFH